MGVGPGGVRTVNAAQRRGSVDPRNNLRLVVAGGRSKRMVKILGLCGSLRAKSTNAGLLRHAAKVAESREGVFMHTFGKWRGVDAGSGRWWL